MGVIKQNFKMLIGIGVIICFSYYFLVVRPPQVEMENFKNSVGYKINEYCLEAQFDYDLDNEGGQKGINAYKENANALIELRQVASFYIKNMKYQENKDRVQEQLDIIDNAIKRCEARYSYLKSVEELDAYFTSRSSEPSAKLWNVMKEKEAAVKKIDDDFLELPNKAY